MKKGAVFALVFSLVWGFVISVSHADLVTIGTATYEGSSYNLIYDADAPMGSIVWLDYTNGPSTWFGQINWASELNTAITSYNIYPAYTVTWNGSWRLPSAGANPQGGYDQTTSELGHLYYEELGLKNFEDRGFVPVSNDELNALNFGNLIASNYWYSTEDIDYPDKAWLFNTIYGGQGTYVKTAAFYALAVHNAQVSTVPIPGAIWLLGSGLLGFVAVRKRKVKKFQRS